MPKIQFIRYLLIILVVLFSLSIKISPVFAANEDLFTITLNPDPVPVDAGRVTITVEKKDGQDFFIQPNYTMAAWTGNLTDAHNSCRILSRRNIAGGIVNIDFGYYYLGDLTTTRTSAVASWNWKDPGFLNFPSSCRDPGSIWHFKLFAGDNRDALVNDTTNVIADYPFSLVQSGAANPVRIEAKNGGNVYAGEKPTVIIHNANASSNTSSNPKDYYTFWWEGDTSIIAGYYPKNKNPDYPLEVTMKELSTDKPIRKLCMEYGYFTWPPGWNDCSPNTTFYFKPGQLPPSPAPGASPSTPQGACEIFPNPPQERDKFGVGMSNLPVKQPFNAELLQESQTIAQASTNSDPIGRLYIKLIDLIPAGKYTVNILDSSGTKLCTKDFEVGKQTLKPAFPPTVAEGETGCEKANEGRGPTIRTAIGCVHTNPAEFTKDILTWVIGISGGIAFLMMLLGAFQMLTSAGNPETLQTGRDRLTSAVIGLLFIIFAILLLQIIGVGILNIPGFKESI